MRVQTVSMAKKKPASQVTKAFALRLAAIREELGYPKKAEFARKIGVEPAAYRKWERGEAEPSLAHLVRIQQLSNVSLDFLIAGRVMPSPFQESDRRSA